MANGLNYLGPVDLTQYFVKSYNICGEDEYLRSHTQGHTGVKVDVVFSRRLLNQVLTTFLPTIALCIVAFSTNYFKVYTNEYNRFNA